MDTTDTHVLLVTAPPEAVESLVDVLLSNRLAACVNVISGVVSHFRWEGRRDRADESLLVVKTRRDLVERATAVIVEAHPYDVPEVIALPVTGGHAPYLDWVRGETRA